METVGQPIEDEKRGLAGERRYGTTEATMELTAARDGSTTASTSRLTITLRQPARTYCRSHRWHPSSRPLVEWRRTPRGDAQELPWALQRPVAPCHREFPPPRW